MAIISFAPMMGPGDRVASLDVGSGKAYVQKFRVRTNTQYDGPATIVAGMGYFYGQKYLVGYPGDGQPTVATDSDLYAYLNSIHVESASEDGVEWIVTFGYAWYDANTIGGGQNQNPLLMPIEVNWSWRDQDLPIDRDIYTKPVVNKAGDPFDPPVTITDPRLVMTVVRNESTINLDLIKQYRNAINSDAWAGYEPLFAHCLSITPKNVFHQLVGWYYQVNYEFEFISARAALNQVAGPEGKGFVRLVVNQGLRAISQSTGKKYHVTYKGIPVSEPVLLDLDGSELPLNRDPTFIEVHAYPELPFTTGFNFDPAAITGNRTGFPPPGP